MKKTLSFFLPLLLLVPWGAQAAAPETAHFSVGVFQDGQMIEPAGDKILLKKKPFKLVFTFNQSMGVMVQGSTDSKTYDLLQGGTPLDQIDSLGSGGAYADYRYNPGRDFLLTTLEDEVGYNYWYYQNRMNHRFDRNLRRKDYIKAWRTIRSFIQPVAETEGGWIRTKTPISEFAGKDLYIGVVSAQYEDGNAQELQRAALHLVFE